MANEELVIRIKAGIDVADNMLQLWQQNRGFICQIANRYRGYDDMDDLEQQGYLGLCDAVEGFKPDEGASFLTYASFWIRQSITRYLDKNSSSLLGIQSLTRVRKYKKLISAFERDLNRLPTDFEIGLYMDLTDKQVETLKKNAQMADMGRLDSPLADEDGELTLGDTVAAPEDIEDIVLDKVQTEQLKEVIWPLVDALPDKQPEVVRARYQDCRTLKETGKQIGITPSAARQCHDKALRTLRHPSKINKLRPFLDDYIECHAFRGNGVEIFNRTWTSSTEFTALRIIEKGL